MKEISKKLFRFFIIGALIFIASYYFMGKSNEILINAGLILLAAAIASKIVEQNIIKKKRT